MHAEDSLIVIDFETNGLPHLAGDRFAVLEVAAVLVSEGRIIDAVSSPLTHNKEVFYDEEVIKLNGLTHALCKKHGAPPREVKDAFARWLLKHAGNGVCYATSYNTPFDFGNILEKDSAWGFTASGLRRGACLMQRTKRALGLNKAPRLVSAAASFRRRGAYVPELTLHRALIDAVVAGYLHITMEHIAKGGWESASTMPIPASMAQLAGAPPTPAVPLPVLENTGLLSAAPVALPDPLFGGT